MTSTMKNSGKKLLWQFLSLWSLTISLWGYGHQAQDIIGFWDIRTSAGAVDTTLEIYQPENQDKLFARIARLHLPQDQGALCANCSGASHNAPLEGLTIIADLQFDPQTNTWSGTALDPDTGNMIATQVQMTAPDKLKASYCLSALICLHEIHLGRRYLDLDSAR